MHSFVHSFVHSFFHLFIHSFIRSFIRSGSGREWSRDGERSRIVEWQTIS